MAVDPEDLGALLLLDLSASFDPADRAILLHRFGSTFSASGQALHWFESYSRGSHQQGRRGDDWSSSALR
jgi:hypothetical protein